MVESVENRRVESVENVQNRRPSDVFLALARYRILGEQSGLEEFADLMRTWAEIVRMETEEDRRFIFERMRPLGPALTPVSEEDTEVPRPSAAPTPPPEREDGEPEPVEATYHGYGASIKNKTREHLLRLRAGGLTSAKLLDRAAGRISQGDLWSILEAKPVSTAVYETLAAILAEVEQADGGGQRCP